MNVTALLTSAGVNTAVCAGSFYLYSVLRKQPSFYDIYFSQKLAHLHSKPREHYWLGRLIPSHSWMIEAWEASEEDLYAVGGVDAVVFLRAVVFSIRVFTVAAIVCMFLVLPLNYLGHEKPHKQISDEQLIAFTIGNVKEGSTWLWAHCLALYIITFCACILLYFEYKNITEMRLMHITAPRFYPSHFTVIVRAIPWVTEESYNDTLTKFFKDYYATSYLSHQMVHHSEAVLKLMNDADKMYKMLKSTHRELYSGSQLMTCGFCGGGTTTSFKMLSDEPGPGSVRREISFDDSDTSKKECGAALVFFRTRYGALVASEALQSTNPMSWVTNAAPEPSDIYWSNLSVPYRILWIRKISVIVALIFFVTFFLFPVVFTQSLVHLDKLIKIFPFMKEVVNRKILERLITGYLPSVVFTIFLYSVAPLMYLFSTLEGVISRSGRKRSTCIKVIFFLIWNVFFANILTEAAIDHYQVSIMKLGDAQQIPHLLAKAVPATATFFMTYVLTSGWATLSVELIQPFPLLCNLFYRYILQRDDANYIPYSFSYHTEVPRVLLFGLLGFTCSILAPLILPFLLVYFVLAFLVYRNQMLNVYAKEYDSGGLYWPIVHNTTIFSLVVTQIIALGVFGLKETPGSLSLTFPLIICTLLFNEYCRHRFQPVFRQIPAKVVMELDRKDKLSGKTAEELQQKLQSSYCQFRDSSPDLHAAAEQNTPDSVPTSPKSGKGKGGASRVEDLDNSSGSQKSLGSGSCKPSSSSVAAASKG